MKTFRKITLVIAGALIALWFLGPSFNQPFFASAAPTSTVVQSLIISNLKGTGTLCLHTNNSGYISTSTADCGTGGGGGGTATTSISGLIDSSFLIKATTTIGISTTTSPSTIWIGPATSTVSGSGTANALAFWNSTSSLSFVTPSTDGKYLVLQSGAPVWTTLGLSVGVTGIDLGGAGMILYTNGDNTLGQASDFVYNPVGPKLGLGVAPSFTLDVFGDINFTGGLNKGGVPITSDAIAEGPTNLYYTNSRVSDTRPTSTINSVATGRYSIIGSGAISVATTTDGTTTISFTNPGYITATTTVFASSTISVSSTVAGSIRGGGQLTTDRLLFLAMGSNTTQNCASYNYLTSLTATGTIGCTGLSITSSTINTQLSPFTFSSSSDIAVSSTNSTFQWTFLNPLGFITSASLRPTSTLNGLTSATYVIAVASDTNVGLAVASSTSPDKVTLTTSWNGTLSDARITSSGNWNSKATSSINLIAGTNLNGGGDLTGANRTFNVSTSPAFSVSVSSTGAVFGTVTTTNEQVTNASTSNLTWRVATGTSMNVSGRVGIGTTAPLSKLDVNGSLAVGTYAGTIAAPANGAVFSGSVAVGTTSVALGKVIVVSPNDSNAVNILSGDINSYVGFTIGRTSSDAIWAVAATTSNFETGSLPADVILGIPVNHGSFYITTNFNSGGRANGIYVASSTGNLGVATTTPVSKLTVEGSVTFTALSTGAGNGAICGATGGLISYDSGANCIVSSLRYKHSINTFKDGLSEVLALRPVTFHYNKGMGNAPPEQTMLGFIAEEADKVDPRLTTRNASGTIESFRYENFTAVLTSAIQDLYSQFQALVARVSGLEGRLTKDEAQMKAMQAEIDALKK